MSVIQASVFKQIGKNLYKTLEGCTFYDIGFFKVIYNMIETSDGILQLGRFSIGIPKSKEKISVEISLLEKKCKKLEEKKFQLSFPSARLDRLYRRNRDAYFVEDYRLDSEISQIQETLDKMNNA